MRTLILVFLCAVLLGCGGDDDPPGSLDGPVVDADPSAPDADLSAPDADPNAPDAAVMADGAIGVECGDMLCQAEQECCATQANNQVQYECIDSGQVCEGASAECDGPEDCGGNACCGTVTGMSFSATCSDTTTCPGGLRFCHTDGDCTQGAQNCCAIPGAGASVCSPAMCGQ